MGNWRKKLVLAEIHFVFRVKIHRWSLNLRYTIGRPVRHVTHRCGVRNGADRVLTWIESYVGYVKAVRFKRVTGLKSRYYVNPGIMSLANTIFFGLPVSLDC